MSLFESDPPDNGSNTFLNNCNAEQLNSKSSKSRKLDDEPIGSSENDRRDEMSLFDSDPFDNGSNTLLNNCNTEQLDLKP